MCALHSWNVQKSVRSLLQGQHFLQDKSTMLFQGSLPGRSGLLQNFRFLSSGEVFTALKPFFFAVHPDLFGQHPRERAVNENSLKQLNEYIESASQQRGIRPARLTFYLRKGNNGTTGTGNRKTPPIPTGNFQSVRIDLGNRDVRQTVYSILEKCNLPTSYVDSLPKTPPPKPQTVNPFTHYPAGPMAGYWRPPNAKAADEDIKKKKAAQDNLENWLGKNVGPAKNKLTEFSPIREEIKRLREDICKTLGVTDVVWDCGWGTRHFRGCLQSFQAMAAQHPECMEVLRNRIVVFGRDTGVSLDGHVILFSGEVRANWLDLIKRVPLHDKLILRIPHVESALSRALKDIKVVHRKFEPTRFAESHETHLTKLITSIGDYRGKSSFPSHWPEKLSHLELVVEPDAGPLMVSPTGQIIVPSSCPAFLLVKFISDHMNEASEKLDQYRKEKYTERDLHSKCVQEFNLVALQKDDNVTPSLMIECCSRLLERKDELSNLLKGTHLWITTYYSVLSDGELCIPWNWKE